MKASLLMLGGLAFALSGCLAIGPRPATDYSPTAQLQSVTLKDTSVHFDSSVLKPGTPRSQVTAAFGAPNQSEKSASGTEVDTYAFNPDGTKFVNPTVRPRNVALGVLTMGTSVAVHHARNAAAERKLTLYHVTYTSEGTIESVQVERGAGAPENGPGAETSSAPPSAPTNSTE